MAPTRWARFNRFLHCSARKGKTMDSKAIKESSSGAGSTEHKEKICFAFQNGTCARGDRCRFQHIAKASHGAQPSSIKSGSALSVTDPIISPAAISLAGRKSDAVDVVAGDTASRHKSAQKVKIPTCSAFSKGNCTWGSKCKFLHQPQVSSAVSDKKVSVPKRTSENISVPEGIVLLGEEPIIPKSKSCFENPKHPNL
jgi:hypothetical protein